MTEPQIQIAAKKELDLLESEWKEARLSIGRFDSISVDLRKYGFSLITFMISASSVVLGIATLRNPFPMLMVPVSIMLAICALFLADRYNEVLLLACVVRAGQIEDASQEILEKHLPAIAYSRLNLTTYLEYGVQQARARMFSLSIYILSVVACFSLGFFSLISHYQEKGGFHLYWYLTALFIFTLVVVVFLLLANRSVSKQMQTIRMTELIDGGRILLKKVIPEKEVALKISALAKKVHDEYQKTQGIIMLAIDKGGKHFANRLQAELKKLGMVNIVRLYAGTRRDEDGNIEEIKIQDKDGKDSNASLRDKDILIVDDLAASGRTIKRLNEICLENHAGTVKVCVLLDAPKKRKAKGISINFAGLETAETEFLVGCGMDFNTECRELEYIGVIKSYKPRQF